jgi:hypothetical protein
LSHTPTGQATRGFSRRLPVILVVCLAAVPINSWPSLAADGAKAAKALPADLALIPEDAAAFLCLEVGRYWNGPEAESLKKTSQAHPLVMTWEVKTIEKETGLSIAEIERFVLVIPEFKAKGNVAAWIFTTRKPFDREKVLSAFVPEAKEMKVGEKKYFVSDKSSNGLQVVNERTLVTGTATGLHTFLSRPAAAKGGAQRQAVAAAADKHLLVAGMVPSVFLPAMKNAGEKGKPFVPLFEAKSWRITVDAAKELQINLLLDFADEAAAKEGQTALKNLIEPLIDFTFFADKGMDAFYKREADKYKGITELSSRYPKLFENTRAALKEFKSEQKGSTVQGTLRIKTDEPVTSFVLLLSMMPRGAKDKE